MKAVVVLSGGQDSATCLALAVKKYGASEVAAITFEYGQRHAIETKYAKRLVRLIPRALATDPHARTTDPHARTTDPHARATDPHARMTDPHARTTDPYARTTGGRARTPAAPLLHKIIRFGFYKDLTTNALFDPTIEISQCLPPVSQVSRVPLVISDASDKSGESDKSDESDKSGARRKSKPPLSTSTSFLHLPLHLPLHRSSPPPPNTVVEGRNAFFLMAAAVWAKTLGAKVLYTGVSQTDYSGYPDCRAVFIRAQERALRLALDYPIRIVTPFMKMTKADEWALAAKLGIFDIIANDTVTCYNGLPGKGCGKCPACRLRNRGLRDYLARAGQ